MKSRILAAALAGAVTFWAGAAAANAIFADRTITASGAGSVGYVNFDVTVAGVFDIFTTSTAGVGGVAPIDPVIFLFNAPLAGPSLAFNDDGCTIAQCGAAVSFSNSLINNIALGVGSYVIAVSDFAFDEAEALSGLNVNSLVGAIRVNVEAVDGGTVALADQVPEPASLALLGAALLGLGVARRRSS